MAASSKVAAAALVRPAECASRRFKPIGRGFGSVSQQAAPDQVRCTKEVQVHLRRTALDEGHPLPRRAAVGSCRDLCPVTALSWLFASIRRAIEPPNGPTPA